MEHNSCDKRGITVFTKLFVCDVMDLKKMSAKNSGEKKKKWRQ